MKTIVATLLASSALCAALPAYAGGYEAPVGEDAPFVWIDDEAQDTATPAPETKSAEQTPVNPVMQDYPTQDAPRDKVLQSEPSALFADDCLLPQDAPDVVGFSNDTGMMPARPDHQPDPRMRRRGEMTGDDGVLEAIQDDPCAKIYRRGGETNASLNEYTRPDDIRRVNTLEDRQIPVHEVGKYATGGSSLWSRDANSPFVDAGRAWRVERGQMLSHMLTGWGEEAGYDVVWDTAVDFVIPVDVVIHGTFTEAAGKVLESYADANPPLDADYFPENHALVVHTSGEFDGR